jgi:iron complex outermembrane receptor protein
MSVEIQQRGSYALKRFLVAGAACLPLVGLPVVARAADDQTAASPPPTGDQNQAAGSTAVAKPPAASPTSSAGDIVVTARHRAENIQAVPAAIAAVSGAFLAETNTVGLDQIAQLFPSVQFTSLNGRNTQVNIRGLGALTGLYNDGLDPGVGFYIDGVYYSRPSTSTFDLIDIADVEVIEGPQGTLYGKNTTAGAVNVTTASPSFTPGGTVEISGGNYGYNQVKAAVTGPLIDNVLAGRFTASWTDRGGLYTNAYNGQKFDGYDDWALRGQLLYTPTSNLKVRLIADYSKQDLEGPVAPITQFWTPPSGFNVFTAGAAFGWQPKTGIDINSPAYSKQEDGGVSLEADWSLSKAVLTSITAWRFWNWRPYADSDFTPLPIILDLTNRDHETQFSQELRVASSGVNKIDYVGGLFYFNEQIDVRGATQYGPEGSYFLLGPAYPSIVLNNLTQNQVLNYRTNSYAGFGQATWHIVPGWNLTGGLRYTYDDKFGAYAADVGGAGALTAPTFTPTQIATYTAVRAAVLAPGAYSVRARNGELSGHADLAYQVTDQVLTYISYSRGYRSEGINLAQLPAGVPDTVAPESIDAYEAGIKTQLFDRRLTLNADIFYENDENYQANTYNATLRKLYLANVPQVLSKGVEVTAQARPTENLSLYTSVTYDDAIYAKYPSAGCPPEQPITVPATTSCNFSGAPLTGVPRWAVSGGFEYKHSISLAGKEDIGYLGLDDSYRSSEYSLFPNSIYNLLPSLNLVNLRLGVRAPSGQWDIYVWGKNVGDVKYYTATSAANYGIVYGFPGDPATYGVTLRVRY